jgi:ABC-type proline/glycine betaine transport system ATPase subunit
MVNLSIALDEEDLKIILECLDYRYNALHPLRQRELAETVLELSSRIQKALK